MKPVRLLLAAMLFVPLLSSAKTVALPPPSGELVLREINYTASLSDTEARFVAEIDLESLNRSEASMPLLDGEVAVLTTKLPDGLRIVREENVYRVVATRQGRFKFKLEFVSKIIRAEPWNQTTFVGPAAAIAAVNAQASGDGMEVQLLSGTVRETTQTNGVARLSGFLGPDRAVSLRWQSKAAEAAHKTVVTCETLAWAQITPNVIKFNTQLKYDIVQGSVARLTLALPAGQALTKLNGAQIRDWQTKTEGDRQVLTVEFITPIEKSYSLTLFSEQGVDTTPLSTQLVPPQPIDITRESGSFSVAAEDVTVETESAAGLRQINATTGTLAAYQFYARPFSLGLKLRRIEAVVNSFSLVTARLEEARLLVKHAVTLNVEKAGIYSVEFGPIGNFTVADVRGDGIEDWKSANGKLSINFSNRALGTRVIEVQLEQAMKAFPEQIEVAPLHMTGAAQESAQIGAASTPGIRLKTGALSGLSEIPITNLGQRTDELLAYASVQRDWKLTLAAERLSSRVIADIFNLVTIGDGLVGGSAAIRYVIVNQGVQEFRVKVPAQWKNIEFTGPNIRRKESDGDTWTISLQDKAWGGYTLVVTYDFQFDPHKATLPVGGIHTLDVERETGSVAVTSAANLEIRESLSGIRSSGQSTTNNASRITNNAAIRRIDEFELAEPDRALISRPVLQAYRYDGADYNLALDVIRFDELTVLDAVADRTQLTTVLTDSGQMLTQASFMVKNNDKQFQRFTMPKGADFWSCYVANQPVKPERDGDSLLVPLPRGANRDQAFPVEIVYALKIGSLKSTWPTKLPLVAPKTDMQTTYAEWELYVPQTHRLANFGGNMTVARGTTYGLRDAWTRFVSFYGDILDSSGAVLVGGSVLILMVLILVWAIRQNRVVQVGVVLAVVAVLAGMLLPALNSSREIPRRATQLNGVSQLGLTLHDGSETTASASLPPLPPATASPSQPPATIAAKVETEKKLNSIVIPEIKFNGTSIQNIIAFLNNESRRLDPQKAGVNIVLNLNYLGSPNPPSPFPPITLNLRDIPLYNVLKLVTDLAGAKFRIDNNTVVVVPLSAPVEGLVTRVYPIQPGVFKSLVEIPEGSGNAGSVSGVAKKAERDDVKRFFTEAGVPFPSGTGITYDEQRGLLIISNTPENLELLDRTLAVVQVAPADQPKPGAPDFGMPGVITGANTQVPGNFSSMVAGIRPIRIELPKTGQRFVFTKVLNVRDEALNLSAVAMQTRTFAAVRGTLQAAAFTIGLAFVWLQLRRKQVNSFLVALGAALIIGSVSHLLISMRWLHVFFILAAPAILIWLLVWLIRRYWKKHPVVTNGTVTTNGHPNAGDAGASSAIAAIAILFVLAGTGNAAETVAGRAFLRGEAPPPSSIEDRSPAAVSVLSATYTGIVRERVAEFDATIDVSAAKADAELPLFNEEVAVSDFSSTYRDATLVRDGKSVSVKLSRRGKTTLHVKFLVKLGGDITKRQVSVAIPPALSSRVTVTIDEPEAGVEFPTAVSFKSTSEKQQTRLDGIIGSGERIEVRWTPRVKRAAEMAATVFVQNTSLVRIGSGVINVRSALDYQVTQGELRQLRVALPTGYRLLKLDGEGIRTWGLKDENGGQILSVELLKGVTASNYPMTLVTEKLLDAMPAQAVLQLPRALEVKRESGLVAICGSEEVNLAVETATDLQRVDADEFLKATGRDASATNVISAYRFQKPEFQLAVRVEAVKPEIEAVVRNRFTIDTERTSLEAQVDYIIKRAGVFTLRLALPTGYSLTGVSGEKIAQWIEKKEGDARTLEVTLKERALGAYNLRVFLTQWQRELPKLVQVVGVAPLDTKKLTGFVGVATAVGVQAKTDSFDGLTEIPASTFDGSGALLAFKFISTETTLPKWKLAVATESVEPWIRAEVVNWLSLNESLLSGRAVIRFDIVNAPVKEFRVRVPAAFKNVEVSGANIRQRDHTNEEWRVQLQNKVFGSYVLTVTWEQPWSAKDGALDLAGVEALGVERETGALAVDARPPLQVKAQKASLDLIAADARELPEWAGRASDATVFAYRYLRPGYKLAIVPKRFDEAEVLQALVDNVHLTTVVAEDGQMMTQMSLSIRNNARQYLAVTLPDKTDVWSAFVAGRAVKPSVQGGKVLLPLERTGADDKPVTVELTYMDRKGSFPRGSGKVDLESPALDVPLKNARWDLYLPVDYRYGTFSGTMMHEAEASPLVSVFSLGDYERAEGEKVAAMKKDVLDVWSMTKNKLASGKVKEANESYNQLRNNYQTSYKTYIGGKGTEELEKDIRHAQAGNVIEAQRQVNVKNAAVDINGVASQPQGAAQIDEKAAEQQWEKLQQAQELATATVQPLHVNLPTHGVRHSFQQVLQTEIGKSMTVQFAASSTCGVGWPMRIGMSVAGFAVLWLISHLVLQKRTS